MNSKLHTSKISAKSAADACLSYKTAIPGRISAVCREKCVGFECGGGMCFIDGNGDARCRCHQDDQFYYTGSHCEIQNPLLSRDDETLIIILCVLGVLMAIAFLICVGFCYQRSREGKLKIMTQETPYIGIEGTYSRMEGRYVPPSVNLLDVRQPSYWGDQETRRRSQAYDDNGLLDVGDVQHDMEYTTPETGSRTSIVITPVLPEYVTPAGSGASLATTPGLVLPSPGDEKFVSATSLIIGPDIITIPMEKRISRDSSRPSAKQDPRAILASSSSITSSESGERLSGVTLVTVTPRSSRSGSRSSSRSRSKPIPSSSSESEDYRTPPMSGSVVFHAPLQAEDTDDKEESGTDVSPRSTTEGVASGASSPSPPQDYGYSGEGNQKGAFSVSVGHRDRPETYGFRGIAPEEAVRDSSGRQVGDIAEMDWYAGETTPVSDPEGWYAEHNGQLGEQSGITMNLPSFYEHPIRDIRHSQPIQEIARRLAHLEGIISGLRSLQTPPERDCYFSEQEELLARIERLEGVLATLPVHVDTPERDWYTSVEEEILTRLSRLEDVISVLPSHGLVEPQWYPRSDFDDFMAGRLEEPNHIYLGDFSGQPEIEAGYEPERETLEYGGYPMDDETPERDWDPEEEDGGFVRLPTDEDDEEGNACAITITHL